MRYLKMHYLIWAVIVLIYTAIESIMVLIAWILIILWFFKIPSSFNTAWENFHHGVSDWDGSDYFDHNIWQTIKRRYNLIHEEIYH